MKKFLSVAYKEALKAKNIDEVPIGAVIIRNNKIIARAHNLKEKSNNPLGHAEIICIQKATKKLNSLYLNDCEMYVTLEPCTMCAGALVNSRIKKVCYGVNDRKSGALGGLYNLLNQKGLNHYFISECLDEEECGNILKEYFREKRESK